MLAITLAAFQFRDGDGRLSRELATLWAAQSNRMVIASDFNDETNAGRTTGSGIVTGLDRSKSIGLARRHTVRVRVLRLFLPVLSIGFVASYAMMVMKTAGVGANLPQVSIPRIIPDQLAMANPHYEGFGKDGSSYVLDSATAQQDPLKPNTIVLNGITGTMVQLDKSKTLFSAVRGDYNSKSGILELYDKIDVNSESGLKVQLTRATLNSKENILISKSPVAVQFSGGTINSNSMTLRHKAHELTFVDNVVARMIPPKPAEEKAAAVVSAATGPGALMFKASDAPLDITSNRLDVKDNDKTAIFTGSVKAVQNDQSLLTPELTVTYDGDAAASPAPAGAPAMGKIKKILAKGPVVMERGVDDRVTADALDFDAAAQKGALIGNVVMKSGVDRQATSDRADLDQAADTILLTGNVFVQQAKNELKGGINLRTIFLLRKLVSQTLR